MSSLAQEKITRSNTRLIIKHPFWGALLLQCKVLPSETIDTLATDGITIWYSPAYVESISQDELTGGIAHEILHIVLKHHLRMGKRNPIRWNHACDYGINPILLDDDLFKLPEGILYENEYRGKSAEAIYDMLPEDEQGGEENGGFFGEVMQPKDKDGKPLSQEQVAIMEADLDAKVIMAANAARSVGKMPAAMEAVIKKMERNQLDLDAVARRFFGGDRPTRYSMRKPSRKWYHTHGIVMPTIERHGLGHWLLGIDISGSVSDGELAYFLGSMNHLSKMMKPKSITVITCDSVIRDVFTYQGGEVIQDIKVRGRGGTSVAPVFKYVDDNRLYVDNMIYFTDLGINDYPSAPKYPVLWASSYRGGSPAPFGKTVYIKTS